MVRLAAEVHADNILIEIQIDGHSCSGRGVPRENGLGSGCRVDPDDCRSVDVADDDVAVRFDDDVISRSKAGRDCSDGPTDRIDTQQITPGGDDNVAVFFEIHSETTKAGCEQSRRPRCRIDP